MSKLKTILEKCRKHIAASLIATAVLGSLIGWGLSWVLPSPKVEVSNLPQKELTCTINFGQPLFIQTNKEDDFKIIYKEKRVENPFLYSITIENTGDEPIENADFKKPLSINFEGTQQIVKASIITASNKDLWDEFVDKADIEGPVLSISDLFLNQGDTFTLNIITVGSANTIHYGHKISGLPKLTIRNIPKEEKNHLQVVKRISIGVSIVACLLGVGMFIYSTILVRKSNKEYLLFKNNYPEYIKRLESILAEEVGHESECEHK